LFFKKENPEKSYENQRLKIAQSLVIGHYNYFYEKIGDWPSSLVGKQPNLLNILSPIEKTNNNSTNTVRAPLITAVTIRKNLVWRAYGTYAWIVRNS